MLNALMRRVGVMADRRANAGDLVGRHARPYPTAAHHDAPGGLAVHDGLSDRGRKVGIVDGGSRIGPEVQHLMAGSREQVNELVLDRVPAVVDADGNAHANLLSCRRHRRQPMRRQGYASFWRYSRVRSPAPAMRV